MFFVILRIVMIYWNILYIGDTCEYDINDIDIMYIISMGNACERRNVIIPYACGTASLC